MEHSFVFCLPFEDFREVAEKLLFSVLQCYMFLRQRVEYILATGGQHNAVDFHSLTWYRSSVGRHPICRAATWPQNATDGRCMNMMEMQQAEEAC